MEVGETVVFVGPVPGVETGKQGRITGLADDKVMVECRLRERLECVLVNTWVVLPERLRERLLKRREMAGWRSATHG
jgi:hypothetical protein